MVVLLASVAKAHSEVRLDGKVVGMSQDPNWHAAAKAKLATARSCAVTQNPTAPPVRTQEPHHSWLNWPDNRKSAAFLSDQLDLSLQDNMEASASFSGLVDDWLLPPSAALLTLIEATFHSELHA